MNRAFLIGNLTRDPELSKTPTDIAVCKFGIACNRRFKNSDGTQEVDFLNIVTWRGLAENCDTFLFKGSKVGVTGSIQSRSYDDKDGNKRYVTEIIADEVEFLSSKNNDQQKPSGDATQCSIDDMTPVKDDGLPF